MKKILIIIIVTLFLTGCYDNIELDDLAIIGGIGIDYYENNYYISYEIFNNNKSDETQNLLSYVVVGEGNTLSKAFINANYKTGKKPFFAHLKVILLSESIIENHLEDIVDYLFRDTEIRDEFQMIVVKNNHPKDILEMANTRHPVISNLINDLLNLEHHNNNLATNETFKELVTKLVSHKTDIILNTISITTNNNISLDNSYIFKYYNYQNELNIKESTLYNMLTKNTHNTEFTKYYKDKNITISINASNTKLEVLNDKIIVNCNLEGRIIENNPKFDLKNPQTYQRLNNDFSHLIKNDIISFIKTLQTNKSDILGFQNIYYKKNNKDNNDLWIYADIDVNIDLKINTKGFIFEVKNEK